MNTHIIHLKNIIIFKILIYILCTIFFFLFLPSSEQSLQESIDRANIASAELKELESKIALVKNYKSEIDQSYQIYLQHIKSSFDIPCFLHATLNDKYIELSRTLNLKEKPVLYSSTEQSIKDFNHLQDVEISTTKIMLTFKSISIQDATNFIKQAYMKLPQYSLITSFDIDDPDIITPDSINELVINNKPSNVTCTSNMAIREIKLKNL